MPSNIYDQGLDRNQANHVPLSPLSFIERSAQVYPERLSVVHGARSFTWSQTYARCRRLASALAQQGIGRGDTVAVMLPNVPAMVEVHFGVPMTGAVLNTLNTRLDADAIALMLGHGEAKLLITDPEFADTVRAALEKLDGPRPVVVDVLDPEYPATDRVGEVEYEDFIAAGDPGYAWQLPRDEWDAIALNYTSGTTGNPKGVVYHHRGAYLNATSNIVSWGMPNHAVYLWTLPMFHCNGWCFPWTLAANAGVSICLRKVDPALIFELIRRHKVSHLCGAPIVYGMLINAPDGLRAGIEHSVSGLIAGAAPPAAIIEGAERIGFDITHVYGLTETYGPASVCAKHPEWNDLPIDRRAERMGEIMFRGNLVMKGYLKNAKASSEAFAGGWFHTGDLAVVHPDGYVKIKDRSKDIIISGGENISSLEIEEVLYRHPAVLTAAVVARPDEKWGEVPAAYIEIKEGANVTADDIVEHCRGHLARFKVPKHIELCVLPKTSTGKIQKFVLRQQAQSAAAIG